MSADFAILERQTILAPLGLRFRDAVTGAPVTDGLVVTAYPTNNPRAAAPAFASRSGAYVLHRAAGLHDATLGAGDQPFWEGLAQRQSFTVEVVDERRRYLPCTFRADLPARGLFTWVWPLEATTAATLKVPAVSLGDGFDDGMLDARRWKTGTLNTPPPSAWDQQVSARELGGRLEVAPRAGQSGKHYNGYLSAATWSAADARISVEVAQVTRGAAETLFTAALDGDNWFRFVAQAGQLLLQTRVNRSDSSVGLAYDAAQHRWWSLRHDPVGDQVLFETSADGRRWARRRAVARQFGIGGLTIELGAGTASSVSSPGVAAFDNFLMESNPAPAVPLYSAPTRPVPAGMAAIRAELWDPVRNAPASYALVEATVAGLRTLRGAADASGRLALQFPYPGPAGGVDAQGNPLPPPAFTRQEWDVGLRAFYAPQTNVPPLLDLGAVLSQPAADLWADEARSATLTRAALRFGQELVLRTKKTTTGAPLDPVPLPVLHITPAP